MRTTPQTWYSGDWKSKNNEQAPYNGVKIIAESNYDNAKKLVDVTVTFIDFTMNDQGISSTVILDKINTWYSIPIPEKKGVKPTRVNDGFTITQIQQNGQEVRLESNDSGIFLVIQFTYGLPHQKREEIGFILRINEFLKEY